MGSLDMPSWGWGPWDIWWKSTTSCRSLSLSGARIIHKVLDSEIGKTIIKQWGPRDSSCSTRKWIACRDISPGKGDYKLKI
jgi:hypothetical protein